MRFNSKNLSSYKNIQNYFNFVTGVNHSSSIGYTEIMNSPSKLSTDFQQQDSNKQVKNTVDTETIENRKHSQSEKQRQENSLNKNNEITPNTKMPGISNSVAKTDDSNAEDEVIEKKNRVAEDDKESEDSDVKEVDDDEDDDEDDERGDGSLVDDDEETEEYEDDEIEDRDDENKDDDEEEVLNKEVFCKFKGNNLKTNKKSSMTTKTNERTSTHGINNNNFVKLGVCEEKAVNAEIIVGTSRVNTNKYNIKKSVRFLDSKNTKNNPNKVSVTDSKRKRRNVVSCTVNVYTFLKIVMMKHRYLLYNEEEINDVDSSLFYEDVDNLKLYSDNGNNKIRQIDDKKFQDYDVSKNIKCNYQRLILISSLSIALEEKNVTTLFSISHLKFLLALHNTFIRDEHFVHVNSPASSSSTSRNQFRKSSSHDNEFIASSKKHKNANKLSMGAILNDFAKNYSNISIFLSKAPYPDIEAIHYMRINKMNLNHSILHIMTKNLPCRYVESRDRKIHDDYVLINVNQYKHLFINVTSYMYCIWEEDRFILPSPSIEREITNEALNDVKLGIKSAIIEVAIGHGQRQIIDVLETNNEDLAKLLHKPYEERILAFQHFFGPKWSIPSKFDTYMDSHSSYVQIPRTRSENCIDIRYYHIKPHHTVAAFGLCGTDVLMAYQCEDGNFEYKVRVPNNNSLNILFMSTPYDTFKRASNQKFADRAKVRYLNGVITYVNDTMRIRELNQIINKDNEHSIVLFHQLVPVTIYDNIKLVARSDLPYTPISEFKAPQLRENVSATRKRSYFESMMATCSEDELCEQIKKRYKSINDLEKFIKELKS